MQCIFHSFEEIDNMPDRVMLTKGKFVALSNVQDYIYRPSAFGSVNLFIGFDVQIKNVNLADNTRKIQYRMRQLNKLMTMVTMHQENDKLLTCLT